MSFSNQATQQKFPFDYNDVYDSLIEVIPEIGMKLKGQDRVIGRVTATTGWSLFSYGEILSIIIERIDSSATLVSIESALKVGVNLAGSHRHQKNFNNIIAALSQNLKR